MAPRLHCFALAGGGCWLLVRVHGLLEATLMDANRLAQSLPMRLLVLAQGVLLRAARSLHLALHAASAPVAFAYLQCLLVCRSK
mgnify:CR=1 FL=1